MKNIKLRKIFILLLVCVFCFTNVSYSKTKHKRSKVKAKSKAAMTCKSAILSNATKGKRLYGRNVNLKVLPASTAKVMTALLVIEKLSLDSYVEVGRRAALTQPSMINIKPGEKYKVASLLYAILLNSANDASIALAEAVSGSEYEFVKLMNQRSRQLGAYNTKFVNSHGLPSKQAQHTTAFDMYIIFRQALKYDFFKEALHYKYKSIFSLNGRQINLTSHNKLLFKDWKKDVYGKTGYTRAAGACFVGAVEKNNDILIIAIFGSTRRWDYIKYIINHYGGIAL